jgi:hypothetical protein
VESSAHTDVNRVVGRSVECARQCGHVRGEVPISTAKYREFPIAVRCAIMIGRSWK